MKAVLLLMVSVSAAAPIDPTTDQQPLFTCEDLGRLATEIARFYVSNPTMTREKAIDTIISNTVQQAPLASKGDWQILHHVMADALSPLVDFVEAERTMTPDEIDMLFIKVCNDHENKIREHND